MMLDNLKKADRVRPLTSGGPELTKNSISPKDAKNTFEVVKIRDPFKGIQQNTRVIEYQMKNKLINNKIKRILGGNSTPPRLVFGYEDIINLFLSEDNAMEAEISFGVTVVPTITDRNLLGAGTGRVTVPSSPITK